MDAATISRQLDTIISLLKLTNQDALVGVRTQLDDVAKAVLDATLEPVTVGKLKKDVATKTSQLREDGATAGLQTSWQWACSQRTAAEAQRPINRPDCSRRKR